MLDWKKLILYPAAIWAVIYLFICALIGFKIDTSASWVWYASVAISIIGLYIAIRAANIKDIKKAMILGLVWVVVMFILDLVLPRPFTGWGYFMTWNIYVSYAITFLMPIVLSFRKN